MDCNDIDRQLIVKIANMMEVSIGLERQTQEALKRIGKKLKKIETTLEMIQHDRLRTESSS